MKNFKYLLLAQIILFTIISCTSPKNKLLKTIANSEKEMNASNGIDRTKGLNLVNLYVDYSNQYADDTASANYIYKAAEITMNLQLGQQAIGYYDEILKNYPDYSKKAECVFLKAFIYENQLNDLENAKKFYTLFLEEFPTHQLAKDAEASIKFLGKSPEELVEMFQEMNRE